MVDYQHVCTISHIAELAHTWPSGWSFYLGSPLAGSGRDTGRWPRCGWGVGMEDGSTCRKVSFIRSWKVM